MRGDPGAALQRLEAGEHSHVAGDQKAQRIHGVPDPADIGDDRDPLPLGDLLDPDPEIFPGGAGESAADLVIKPDLVVPLQRVLHRRLEDLVAIFVGDAALGDDSYNIVREPLDNLDHRFAPLVCLPRYLGGPRRSPPDASAGPKGIEYSGLEAELQRG